MSCDVEEDKKAEGEKERKNNNVLDVGDALWGTRASDMLMADPCEDRVVVGRFDAPIVVVRDKARVERMKQERALMHDCKRIKGRGGNSGALIPGAKHIILIIRVHSTRT